MPNQHSLKPLAETEPSWNGRAGNRMKSNHYGQKLAGFRVLCVPYCYVLLYRRQANCSHTEGSWQSCVIEADRASGGWPSRALLAPGRDYRGRVDSRDEDLLPCCMDMQAPWWMTPLICVVRSLVASFFGAAPLPGLRPSFRLSLFHPLSLPAFCCPCLFVHFVQFVTTLVVIIVLPIFYL